MDEQINRNDLIYESSKYVFDFRLFQTIRSFGERIFSGKITISEAYKKQSNLLDVILKFDNKVRPKSKPCKEKKRNACESAYVLYEGRALTLGGIFPSKESQKKKLTSKQMLQKDYQ